MNSPKPDYIKYWKPNKEFYDAVEYISEFVKESELDISLESIEDLLKWIQWKAPTGGLNLDNILKKLNNNGGG
ncbi:MAG: hypothetical protein GY849_21560 [Deltaproteobacteria bacterium]|nr:hypothetical protein [Deltaproteobacteria bacterium]